VSFPGSLENQTVFLSFDPSQFRSPDAVLVFLYTNVTTERSCYDWAPLSLLFVRHKKRGWELPGGKLEPDDGDPAAAAARELFEESGYRMDKSRLFPFAQYIITATDGKTKETHTKTVFVGHISSDSSDTKTPEFTSDTDDCSFRSLSELANGFSSVFKQQVISPLIQDSVFDICLPLSSQWCSSQLKK
jgi:8-oxo-dGTP diphosphatase